MEEKFETIDNFCSYVCNCACSNDWYCPKECDLLEKARKMPFVEYDNTLERLEAVERIQKGK